MMWALRISKHSTAPLALVFTINRASSTQIEYEKEKGWGYSDDTDSL
jgi:hypothetical protein